MPGFAEHVPFDTSSREFRTDPYPFFEALRHEQGPIYRTPAGALLLLGFSGCAAVFRDPRFGHGAHSPRDRTAYGVPARSFLLMDPPEHTATRGRLRAPMGRQAASAMAPAIERRLAELMRHAVSKGTVNVVSDIARPLATAVISDVLGVPEGQRREFGRMAELLAQGLDPESVLDAVTRPQVAEARTAFVRCFRHLLTQAPHGQRTSVLQALKAADGQPLSLVDAMAACGQLLAAGYDTTIGLISNGLYALLSHPEQLRLLERAEVSWESAVEELLRYDPPIQFAVRTALEDAEIAGHQVPKGTLVVLLLAAANRDPVVHRHAHELDLRRPQRHLSFGLGAHFCLGAPLARLTAGLALPALVRHRPRLLPHREVRRKPTTIVRGLEELWVELT
ncbi:cytochrome P450 [Streptomyces sp. NPDC012769]|uniref:cytochrome P450 n=1 Tax=Streptomyces sp. NPDC012769 TaxID=3364848 RepID=UPI0036A9D3A1